MKGQAGSSKSTRKRKGTDAVISNTKTTPKRVRKLSANIKTEHTADRAKQWPEYFQHVNMCIILYYPRSLDLYSFLRYTILLVRARGPFNDLAPLCTDI